MAIDRSVPVGRFLRMAELDAVQVVIPPRQKVAVVDIEGTEHPIDLSNISAEGIAALETSLTKPRRTRNKFVETGYELSSKFRYTVDYLHHSQLGRRGDNDLQEWQAFGKYLEDMNFLFGEGETVSWKEYKGFVLHGAKKNVQGDAPFEQGAFLVREASGKVIGYISTELYSNPDPKSLHPALCYIDYAVIGTEDKNAEFNRKGYAGAFALALEAVRERAQAYGKHITSSRGQLFTENHDVPIIFEVEDPRLMTRGKIEEMKSKDVDVFLRYILYGQQLHGNRLLVDWVQKIEDEKAVTNLALMVASSKPGMPRIENIESALLIHWIKKMHPVSLSEGVEAIDVPEYAKIIRDWGKKRIIGADNDRRELIVFLNEYKAAQEAIENMPARTFAILPELANRPQRGRTSRPKSAEA